jgi:hypothetical protein
MILMCQSRGCRVGALAAAVAVLGSVGVLLLHCVHSFDLTVFLHLNDSDRLLDLQTGDAHKTATHPQQHPSARVPPSLGMAIVTAVHDFVSPEMDSSKDFLLARHA